jgi:uncharacterized membrane protein
LGFFNLAIFLAALGITTLEMVEASAVGLALYSDSKRPVAFSFVSLGVLAVFAPMFAVGKLISLLPVDFVRLIAGSLLLYFGLRLLRSARRSVLYSRKKSVYSEHFEKGLFATGFSVGAVEAFEAAIVLVGLLPNNYDSTTLGLAGGILVVILATYLLRNQVRRVKQANMKVMVSALLLSFAVFWFSESVWTLSDIVLIPLFALFSVVVYATANRPSPAEPIPEFNK